ncbi:MAG: ABC transporter permease [bacterium]|nr:ABC transporter permease [bacterium]
MTKFIIRRLLQAIPTLFGITILTYLILVAAPGDPVTILTFDPNQFNSRELVERVGARLGVNDPLPVQYLRWLLGDDWMRWDSDGDGLADGSFLIPLDADGDGEPEPPGERRGIIRGDFGTSFVYNRDPLELIGARLPATLELNVAVLVVGLTLGIPLGVYAAIKRGGWFDNSTRLFAVIGNAVPDFWMGFVMIIIFGAILGILPLGGRNDPIGFRDPYPPIWERWNYLVMPTLVSALGVIAGYSRYMRTSMLETINSDFVRTARAKGLTNTTVWFKHAFRNSMIPLATFLGPTLFSLLGGSVVIERIFSWPGVGLLLLEAVNNQDFPVVMASTFIFSTLTIFGYLMSDILYAIFDPRIRY